MLMAACAWLHEGPDAMNKSTIEWDLFGFHLDLTFGIQMTANVMRTLQSANVKVIHAVPAAQRGLANVVQRGSGKQAPLPS